MNKQMEVRLVSVRAASGRHDGGEGAHQTESVLR